MKSEKTVLNNSLGYYKMFSAFLYFSIVLIIYLLSSSNLLTHIQEFWLLNVVLFLFIVFQIINHIKNEGREFLSSILIVFYFFHFFVQVLLSNLVLLDSYTLPFTNDQFLAKTMYIYIISSLFFTLGFDSKISKVVVRIFNSTKTMKGIQLYVRNKNEMNFPLVTIIIIFSSFIYFFAINAGIIGYSASNEEIDTSKHYKYQQYFNYIKELIYIGFFVLYLEIIKRSKSPFILKILFSFSIIVVLYFGLLNGMKKEVFAPFVFLFFINFLYKKRLKFKLILTILLLVLLSYQFMESIREDLRSDYNQSRIEIIIKSFTSNKNPIELNTVFNSIARRSNQTEAASNIIYYGDIIGVKETDPNFLSDLIILPITSFIPRFILPIKPVATYGLWVTREVYGLSFFSASYITIEGYLYLAGGFLAIGVGMFIIGALGKIIFLILLQKNSNNNYFPIFIISYILILRSNFFEPSEPVTMIVSLLRNIIIYPVLVSLFYKKVK